MSDAPPEINAFLACGTQGEREKLLASHFSKNRDRLYAMVDLRLDRRVRGRVSPSDVIQEAFLEASKRLGMYLKQPDLPVFIWMRRVTVDTLYDAHRHHLGTKARDVRREVRIDQPATGPEAPSGTLAVQLVKLQVSPSDAAIGSERARTLEKALEMMDPFDREIISLRAVEMLSSSEAARVLGIESAAGRKRYERALQRLKLMLDETGLGEPGTR